MKKITFIFLACILSMLSLATTTTNLIKNGSFEIDKIGVMPKEWILKKSKTVSVINDKAQEGSQCVSADTSGGQVRLEQYVNEAKAGKKYRFSFYYTDYASSSAFGIKNYSNAGKGFEAGYMEGDYPARLEPNTPDEWKYYSCEFTAKTDTVKISLRCYEDTKLDNIVMEEIEGGSLPSNEVDDIAAFIAMANETQPITITGKVNVTYVNEYTKKDGSLSSSVYLQDASGWILMYSDVASNLSVGQSLTGLVGVYNERYAKNQIINATIPTPVNDVVVDPAVVAITDLSANDVNRYIKISNVTITEKTDGQYTNQFAVDSDNNELWVYDKFQLGQTLTVGSTYDIEGIVTLYKSELELAITKITTDGNAVELVNADQLSFDGNSVINPNQVDIVVYSISGSIVKSGNTNLNLSDLHSGLYMVVSSNDILKVLK